MPHHHSSESRNSDETPLKLRMKKRAHVSVLDTILTNMDNVTKFANNKPMTKSEDPFLRGERRTVEQLEAFQYQRYDRRIDHAVSAAKGKEKVHNKKTYRDHRHPNWFMDRLIRPKVSCREIVEEIIPKYEHIYGGDFKLWKKHVDYVDESRHYFDHHDKVKSLFSGTHGFFCSRHMIRTYHSREWDRENYRLVDAGQADKIWKETGRFPRCKKCGAMAPIQTE